MGEPQKENDLFFVCSLIEYIARKTKKQLIEQKEMEELIKFIPSSKDLFNQTSTSIKGSLEYYYNGIKNSISSNQIIEARNILIEHNLSLLFSNEKPKNV